MNTSSLTPIGTILVSFLCTLFVTAALKSLLARHRLLDHPNDRSSHTVAVPRGGGWAFVIVLFPIIFFVATMCHVFVQSFGLFVGLVLLITISWLDDRRGISPIIRLSLHLLATASGVFCLAPTAAVFGHFLPLWLDRALTVIAWTWFLNLYNFMDGIDGITCVETIALAVGINLVITALGLSEPFVAYTCLALIGCCLGFLALNWSPAKIFMGDVGSVPLGYLIGFLLIGLAVRGHFAAALILPLYYLADSGITIAARAARGEKIWLPHRQHFYQRSAQGLRSHPRVVIAITGCNISLIIIALVSLTFPVTALALAVLSVAILLAWMHKKSFNMDH